jgi:uncharacterized membrane protein (DUF2068 family)
MGNPNPLPHSTSQSHILPLVVLIVLAPAIAELLSGYLPPAWFFQPLSLAMNFAFYSSGAILIRELLVRWEKGWPTLLMLGAAFALLEEGLMTKAIFNPEWPEMAMRAGYDRLGGVNWIMALRLIIYHSVLSICIPIVTVHFMFPKRRAEPWIKPWVFAMFTLFLAAGTAFGYIFLTPYRIPFLQLCLGWLTFFLLIALAKWLPREPFKLHDRPHVSRWWFFMIGLLAPIGFVVFGFKIPSDGRIPAWAALLLLAGFMGLILWLVLKLSGNCGAWKARQRFALASGVLVFSSTLLLLNEQNYGSKWLIGPAGLFFVMMMARQARRVESYELQKFPSTHLK